MEKQILIPSNKSKDYIVSSIRRLDVGEKAYFNMFQDGGACIVRTTSTLYALFEIPLYGGKESFEMSGYFDDIEVMVNKALSWT
jgi:hypothetical protein